MSGARITLSNPTAGDWDDFIRRNAERSGAAQFMREYAEWVRRGKRGRPPVSNVRVGEKNGGTGRHLVICGAGPSLGSHWEHYLGTEGIARSVKTDVWACNSALTWLYAKGAHVTHGFAIDQTEGMLAEWPDPPPVRYMLASTVNPKLTEHILGHGRRIVWFHNYVGSPEEIRLYTTIWPTAVMVGDGLNSVNRAMCLAQHMNYKRITVLGADCALGPDDVMHVNGDGPTAHGATAVLMDMGGTDATIGGRQWKTKPDMLFSAVAIARMAYSNSRFVIVGDTFPNALIREGIAQGMGTTAFREYMDKNVASLENMRGGPRLGHAGATPKGRNMLSGMFTVAAGSQSDPGAPLLTPQG
jgi:hypothetical protein